MAYAFGKPACPSCSARRTRGNLQAQARLARPDKIYLSLYASAGHREPIPALELRVRGEDLLNERGSGSWQPDNQNRIRVRHAGTHARGKELLRADLDL